MGCCSFLHYSQPQILEDTEGISLSVMRSQEHVYRTRVMPDIPDGLYICTTERKMRFRVYNAVFFGVGGNPPPHSVFLEKQNALIYQLWSHPQTYPALRSTTRVEKRMMKLSLFKVSATCQKPLEIMQLHGMSGHKLDSVYQ